MRFLSVCSGIEAASMAWSRRSWQAVAFSEIDPFASAVLAERHPDVPNWGDMTKFEEWPDADVDVLVGGTPCQSFSVAGLRKGLDDQRGNLMLVYAAIARKYRPKWVVWENVPGVLSDDGGRGFGSLLGILSGKKVEAPAGGWESAGTVPGLESAYGLAWRVLDAQFVRVDTHPRAVPQRRKRVFVVGCLGDGGWRRAAAVLFERDSLSGNPAPRREAGQRVAPTVEARANAGGAGWGTDFLAGGGLAADCEVPLNAIDGASHAVCAARMVGGASEAHGETFIGAPIAFGGNNTAGPIDVATACRAKGGSGHGDFESETFVAEVAPTLDANFGKLQGASGQDLNHGHSYLAAEAYAFKASHYTRGKDGAPSSVAPALSADADKGDQDTLVLAFDETQITNPENRCQPKPGDPSHPLAAGARPPTICFSAKDSGGDAMDECAPTLRAGHHIDGNANAGVMPAIAFQNLDRPHARTQEANSGTLLRGVREALGEKAFAQWGLGILDTLQPPEILRSALHGSELRPAPFSRRWVVCCALGGPVSSSQGAVQSMFEAGRTGRAPQGREPSEQLARELGAYLSGLSQPGAQAERFMHDLWIASEGLGVLREALSEVQKARRPARQESEPTHASWRVRRLMVEECEFLQGFPRGYTAITYRGKPAADGPRYRTLGNSMAVNCMAWIGQRIELVEAL